VTPELDHPFLPKATQSIASIWSCQGAVTASEKRNEKRVLAAFEELLEHGVLHLVNDDLSAACQFPSHRGSEYVVESSRVVCGVCHPDPRRTKKTR
jgi:hypothetical protein